MGRTGRIWKKRGQKQSRDMKQGGVIVHNSGFIPSREFLVEVFQRQKIQSIIYGVLSVEF